MFEIAYDRAHQFGVKPMIISHRQPTIAVIYLEKFVFSDSALSLLLQVKTLVKSKFVSNSISVNTSVNLLAFITSFEFGSPAFPERGAIFLKKSFV